MWVTLLSTLNNIDCLTLESANSFLTQTLLSPNIPDELDRTRDSQDLLTHVHVDVLLKKKIMRDNKSLYISKDLIKVIEKCISKREVISS